MRGGPPPDNVAARPQVPERAAAGELGVRPLLLFVEVIVVRPLGMVIAFLALVPAAGAGDPADPKAKEFAKDIEQLNGTWVSPTTQLGPGVTGPLELKLEFEKDSTVGRATFLNFYSRTGIFVKVGPSCGAELKKKDDKRFIVLTETKDGERTELGEIAYEVNGDKLKLASPTTLRAEKRGNPLEMTGDWERKKADKK